MPLSSGEDTPPDHSDEPLHEGELAELLTARAAPAAPAQPALRPSLDADQGALAAVLSAAPRKLAPVILPDDLMMRPGLPADTEALNRMLARSYRALLAPDYPAAELRLGPVPQQNRSLNQLAHDVATQNRMSLLRTR